MTGTSERARSARRKSRPLPSGSTRSRMMRSASALRCSASRSAAASSIANPSRRSAKARLSRMAGSSSTTRTTGTGLLLRRGAESGGRRRLLAPLGHGQGELVVPRLDDPQPDRRAQRGAQRRQARLLHQEPLAVAWTRHELAQLLVLLELPHPVLRVEGLPAPVHQIGADGLVGRALVIVLPEQVALGPV